MSSYVQPRRAKRPTDITNVMCTAPLCTTYIQEQYYERSVYLCQEHALAVWATVQEMADPDSLKRIAARRVTTPEELYPDDFEPIPISEAMGDVYFIKVGALIKVGFSSDLDRRLRAYPPDAELLAYHRGTYADEQRIHKLLTVHRANRREWYHPTDEVLAEVEAAKVCHESDPKLTDEEMAQYRRTSAAMSKKWHDIPPVIA